MEEAAHSSQDEATSSPRTGEGCLNCFVLPGPDEARSVSVWLSTRGEGGGRSRALNSRVTGSELRWEASRGSAVGGIVAVSGCELGTIAES